MILTVVFLVRVVAFLCLYNNEVEPHCVSADYVGATMGEHHTANIKFGDAYTKSNLTWKDAASLEERA